MRDSKGRFVGEPPIKIICKNCGKEKHFTAAHIKAGGGKYCSRECFNIMGRIHTGHLGKKHSEETKKIIREKRAKQIITPEQIAKMAAKSWMRNQFGENNKMWKGGISKTIEYKRHMKEQNKMRRKQVKGSHTFEEWKELKETYKNMCLCCKRQEPEIKLTEDHIIPVSMGGTDYIWNIQPLCLKCNIIKNAKEIDYRERMVI